MKVMVLYHPNSAHEREVLNFKDAFVKQLAKQPELISLETVEGADKARLYDITRYPAVIALDNEGRLLRLWDNEKLPLVSEVGYYAKDNPATELQ